MGMTNEQYKGMLLDELEDWQEVLKFTRMAEEDNLVANAIREKAEQQIAKINEKMKF